MRTTSCATTASHGRALRQTSLAWERLGLGQGRASFTTASSTLVVCLEKEVVSFVRI